MPAVQVEGVSQRFTVGRPRSIRDWITGDQKHKKDFWALTDVSFELAQGHSLALVGPNGSGKSSLLALVAGIMAPTLGTVSTKGRISALLELGSGFQPEASGRENIYLSGSVLGLSRPEIRKRFDDIVDFSGVSEFIDSPLKTYSSGMMVRLGFSVASSLNPDILIVDEVLAVGDEAFKRQCLTRIRELQHGGCSIILVTHEMAYVEGFTSEAILLDHGKVVSTGPASRIVQDYHELMRKDDATLVPTVQVAFAPVRIEAVRCYSGRRPQPAQLSPGDDLEIQIDVASQLPTDNWSLMVGIWAMNGDMLFVTSTELWGSGTGLLDGERTVTFRLPKLPLAGGNYRIGVELQESGWGPVWQQVPVALQFEVSKDPRYWAPLHVDAQCDLGLPASPILF